MKRTMVRMILAGVVVSMVGLVGCDTAAPAGGGLGSLGNLGGGLNFGGGGGRGGVNGVDAAVHGLGAAGHLVNAAGMSEKDEDALGQSVGVAVTNRYHLVTDQALLKYVNLVGFTVASASSRPGGNYVFGVLETPEVNAMSGPNGYIFVTRGALAMMRDEAELAGVLAHEIGHVCSHDGLEQVKGAEQRAALAEGAQMSGRTAGFAGIADMGVDVITKQGFSQPQEFAADKSGVVIMTAAGYDAASYLRFLQRLQAAEGRAGGGRFMSTHPGVGERVGKVSGQLATVRAGGATLAERFQANVPFAGK